MSDSCLSRKRRSNMAQAADDPKSLTLKPFGGHLFNCCALAQRVHLSGISDHYSKKATTALELRRSLRDEATKEDPRQSGFLSRHFRQIFSDRNYKNLFMFTVLELNVALLSSIYGSWCGSLGTSTCANCLSLHVALIASAFHLIYDALGMLIAMNSLVLSRTQATFKYSYG